MDSWSGFHSMVAAHGFGRGLVYYPNYRSGIVIGAIARSILGTKSPLLGATPETRDFVTSTETFGCT